MKAPTVQIGVPLLNFTGKKAFLIVLLSHFFLDMKLIHVEKAAAKWESDLETVFLTHTCVTSFSKTLRWIETFQSQSISKKLQVSWKNFDKMKKFFKHLLSMYIHTNFRWNQFL